MQMCTAMYGATCAKVVGSLVHVAHRGGRNAEIAGRDCLVVAGRKSTLVLRAFRSRARIVVLGSLRRGVSFRIHALITCGDRDAGREPLRGWAPCSWGGNDG